MKATLRTILTCAAFLPAPLAMGQGPDGGGGPITNGGAAARLMQFDADKDGKLTRDELTDSRLGRLFDRLDTNKDDVVTKDEAAALTTEDANRPRGNGGPGGFGGPGGPGGPPGRGGFPRPGEVLPGMLRQHLKVTSEQAEELDELQRDVDARLAKILTTEQASELKTMQERGPAGPPGRGGPPGGGPGGNRRRGGGPPGDGPPRRGGPPEE